MILLVALWAAAEAILWVIVADVPLSWLALRRGVRAGLVAALVAAGAAALAGAAMMRWAAADPDGARATLVALPAIGPAMIDRAVQAFAAAPFDAMLAASVSGVPYKLFAFAAGQGGALAPAPFVALSLLARLPRFIAVALIAGLLGRWLRPRLAPRLLALLFAAFWTLFYALYFAAVPD